MLLLLLAQPNLQLFKEGQTTEDPTYSVSTVRSLATPWTDATKSMAFPLKHRIEGVEAISMHPTEKHTIPGQLTQAEVQAPNLPGLNPDQTKQLYQFLSNLTNNGTTKSGEPEVNTTNMTGIFSSLTATRTSNAICFTCQLGKDVWILDSGASDHMSYDASFLHGFCYYGTNSIHSQGQDHQV